MNTKHLVLIFTLLFCSCAGYKPVIDTAQVEDMDQYDRDELECENLSHEHSNTGNATVAGAGIGAALGAGVGALIGQFLEMLAKEQRLGLWWEASKAQRLVRLRRKKSTVKYLQTA